MQCNTLQISTATEYITIQQLNTCSRWHTLYLTLRNDGWCDLMVHSIQLSNYLEFLEFMYKFISKCIDHCPWCKQRILWPRLSSIVSIYGTVSQQYPSRLSKFKIMAHTLLIMIKHFTFYNSGSTAVLSIFGNSLLILEKYSLLKNIFDILQLLVLRKKN